MPKINVTIEMNDAQLESFKKMVEKSKGMHYADVTMRKDGANHHFEADWIKNITIQ